MNAPFYMTAAEAAHHLRISRRTLDYWVREGKLPPPMKLTRKTVRWLRSDIEALMTRSPA